MACTAAVCSGLSSTLTSAAKKKSGSMRGRASGWNGFATGAAVATGAEALLLGGADALPAGVAEALPAGFADALATGIADAEGRADAAGALLEAEAAAFGAGLAAVEAAGAAAPGGGAGFPPHPHAPIMLSARKNRGRKKCILFICILSPRRLVLSVRPRQVQQSRPARRFVSRTRFEKTACGARVADMTVAKVTQRIRRLESVACTLLAIRPEFPQVPALAVAPFTGLSFRPSSPPPAPHRSCQKECILMPIRSIPRRAATFQYGSLS